MQDNQRRDLTRRACRARHIDQPSRLLVVLLTGACVLSTAPAWAAVAQSTVRFTHEAPWFEPLTWDSGWQPADAKVQVRLVATVKGGFDATLPGVARLDRSPAGAELSYQGEAVEGIFGMGLQWNVVGTVRLNGLEVFGKELHQEIPFAPAQLNRLIRDEQAFAPFSLEGSPDHKVTVKIDSPKVHLYTFTIVPLVIYGIQVNIQVPLHVGARLRGEFRGDRIETSPAVGEPLSHTAEGQRAPWPETCQLRQEGEATFHAQNELALDLMLYPSIRVEIDYYLDDEKIDIAEFEVEKAVDAELWSNSNTWDFAPQPLAFNFDTNDGPGCNSPTPDRTDPPPVGGNNNNNPPVDPIEQPPITSAAPSTTPMPTQVVGGCSTAGAPPSGDLLLWLLVLGIVARRWR